MNSELESVTVEMISDDDAKRLVASCNEPFDVDPIRLATLRTFLASRPITNGAWTFNERTLAFEADMGEASMGGQQIIYDPWEAVVPNDTLVQDVRTDDTFGREIVGWNVQTIVDGTVVNFYLFNDVLAEQKQEAMSNT